MLVGVVALSGCKPSPDVANKRLYDALLAKDFKEVKSALAAGADPNLPRRDLDFRYSPLEVAVDRPDIVELLLKNGAAPKKSDAQGFLPLGMAAGSGATKSVELILKAGALLESKDSDGMTALARAAGGGKLDNAKFLISCGANVNTKDRRGYTPLFHVVLAPMGSSGERTELARLFIEHGANIAAVDAKGRTAASYAETTFPHATGASQSLIDLLTNPLPKEE